MVTILTNTFHASALIILSVVMALIRTGKGYMEHKYRKLLILMSVLFAINMPSDIVMIYNEINGVSSENLGFSVFRFIDIVSVSLVIMAFHHLLGTPRKQLRIAQYSMALLLVLCFFHIVFYTNYRVESNLSISIVSYIEYCVTPPAIYLQYVIYFVLFAFIIYSLLHFFYISRLYNMALADFEKEIGEKKKLSNAVFRHVYHIIGFYAIDIFWPVEYYNLVYIFWIIVSVGWTVYVINNKKVFMEMNRLAAFVYIKVESSHLSLSWYNIILGRRIYLEEEAETKEERMNERERAIVTRAVMEWENDPERYFDKPNYTFKEYSEQIGIPMGVLLKHGLKVSGSDFDEYINNLRELK